MISQRSEARDIESHLSRHIRDNIKVVVAPLHSGFIGRGGAEQVEPGALERAVICADRTAPSKARQRLHIRTFLQLVNIAVAEKNLVLVAESVIKAAGRLEFPRVEPKYSAVGFNVEHKERILPYLT